MILFAVLLFLNSDPSYLEQAKQKSLTCFKVSAQAVDPETARVMVSPHGTHVVYSRKHLGLPVLDRTPKAVHLSPDLKRVIAMSESKEVSFPAFGNINARDEADILGKAFPGAATAYRVTTKSRYYLVEGVRAHSVVRLHLEGTGPLDERLLDVDSLSHKVLRQFQPNLRAAVDGTGKVWRHNPIAATRGNHQDSGLVDVPLRGLDGSGYLRGPYVDVTDPSLAHINPEWASRYALSYRQGAAFEPGFSFSYDPEDVRFEEVSVYYWIDTAQRFLQSKGFHIFEHPIGVNVHRFEGTDASFSTMYKTIVFGDGFIDTAEDGSVVTHEYGHAILDDIAGPLLYDYYGSMFHEGFADFFSYLVSIEASNEVGPDRYPDLIGEYFGSFKKQSPPFLRSLNPPGFKLPFLKEEPHADGTLWSSALFEMAQTLGSDVAVNLIMESLYYLSSAQPKEVIRALLLVDHNLYQGRHQQEMLQIMRDRGLWEPELTAPAISLPFNQAYNVVTGQTLFRFHSFDQPAIALDIRPESLTFPAPRVLLAKGRVPTVSDFDKIAFIENETCWTFSTESRPALENQEDYYLLVDTRAPLQLSVGAVQVTQIQDLPETESVHVEVESFHFKSYRLEGVSEYQRVMLRQSFTGAGYIFISAHAPVTSSDYVDDTVYSSYLGASAPFVVDLDAFPDVDTLFVTIEQPFDQSNAGDLSWHGLQGDGIHPPLTPGIAQSVALGDPWDNSWYFDLEQDVPAITITVDTSQCFFLDIIRANGDFERIQSATHGGNQVVQIDPGYWFINADDDTPLVGANPGAGRYILNVDGEKGHQVQIQISLSLIDAPVQLSEGDTIVRQLGPFELVHYQFVLPGDAQDIRFYQQPLDGDINFYVHDQVPPNDVRFTWTGVLDQQYHNFRFTFPIVEIPDPFMSEPHFAPGATYDLWFYNPTAYPQQLDGTLCFSREVIEAAELGDGKEITMPSDSVDQLIQERAQRVPFWVRPPSGTQKVIFRYEYLTGSRNLTFLTVGKDHKIISSLMADTEISRFDLNEVPEKPFKVWFYTDQEPEQGPAHFRVSLEFVKASAFHGSLSPAQPSLQSGLVSLGDWRAEIRAPMNTNRIDLAWIPYMRPLDVPTTLQVTSGQEKPFDVSEIYDTLRGGRRDYATASSTPYQSLNSDKYVLSLLMFPSFKYTVGYVEGAEPFPFQLAAQFQRNFSTIKRTTIRQVGPLVVQHAYRRLINPRDELVTMSFARSGEAQSYVIPPHGFLDASSPPGDFVEISADGPLVLNEGLAGAGFLTNAMAPAFSESSFWLPHISPNSSSWTSYIAGDFSGETELRLTSFANEGTEISVTSPSALANGTPSASFRRMQTGTLPNQIFPESELSATQFWQNQNQLVAEIPPTKGSRTYFVPHLPDQSEWWSGLTLSNPSKNVASISVRAFGADGAKPKTLAFELPAGASRVGLMDTYLAANYTTQELRWLRIDASEPILAMEFMGGIQIGDTGGFLLPGQDGTDLVLSGNLLACPFGVAVVNTVAQSGRCQVEAHDQDGRIVAELLLDLGPNQRILLTNNMFNVPADQKYSLRIHTDDLRLVALQLDINDEGGLATTAAQVIR